MHWIFNAVSQQMCMFMAMDLTPNLARTNDVGDSTVGTTLGSCTRTIGLCNDDCQFACCARKCADQHGSNGVCVNGPWGTNALCKCTFPCAL